MTRVCQIIVINTCNIPQHNLFLCRWMLCCQIYDNFRPYSDWKDNICCPWETRYSIKKKLQLAMLFDITNIYNIKKTLMKGLRNETLTTITFKSKSRMIFCHIIDIWHLYKDGGTTQCSTLMFMLSPILSPVASSNYINTYLNIALYQHLRLRHENAWMHEQHLFVVSYHIRLMFKPHEQPDGSPYFCSKMSDIFLISSY